MSARRITARNVEQERARARGARRLLPWALLTAVSGGALAAFAGGGLRGGAALFAVGLVFALFLWVTSVARCPACGAPLGRARAPGQPESCARCRTPFEPS